MASTLTKTMNGCTVTIERHDNGTLWIQASGKVSKELNLAIRTLNYSKYDPAWAMNQLTKAMEK